MSRITLELYGGKFDGKLIETVFESGTIFTYHDDYYIIRKKPLDYSIRKYRAIKIDKDVAESITSASLKIWDIEQ
jgi:hypothetical protein